jgi:hypothetical protein
MSIQELTTVSIYMARTALIVTLALGYCKASAWSQETIPFVPSPMPVVLRML